MGRPVTLFTGQWADLPLEQLCKKAAGFGYDGLELACWGDHFEVDKALSDDTYCAKKRDLLDKHDLQAVRHLESSGRSGCSRQYRLPSQGASSPSTFGAMGTPPASTSGRLRK